MTDRQIQDPDNPREYLPIVADIIYFEKAPPAEFFKTMAEVVKQLSIEMPVHLRLPEKQDEKFKEIFKV